MAEAESVIVELKLFLEIEPLDEIKKKLDKFYMVMILRPLNLDYDHVRGQLLLLTGVGPKLLTSSYYLPM